MGAAESICYQVVSGIKSGDAINVKCTRVSDGSYLNKTIRFDDQEWDRMAKIGYGQMLIEVQEKHWPQFVRQSWGVGTGFPDVEMRIEWKNKVCTFFTNEWCSETLYHLPKQTLPLPTYQFYVHEDGIRVGAQPLKGILWGVDKDKRRVIPWEDRSD